MKKCLQKTLEGDNKHELTLPLLLLLVLVSFFLYNEYESNDTT